MANSALLLDSGVDLLSEDIGLSLHSLQALLEDLKDNGEEKTKKSKKHDKKIYIDEDGIKSFFYGDDEDVYEDDEDDEEEYPTVDNEDQEKLREAARKIASRSTENEEQSVIEKINYERVNAAQRTRSTVYQNNINYPTDRTFQSVVIENKANTDVYNSLLNVAMAHNLQIEVKTYEGWGGGGIYIEAINGVKNGDNGYFWEYIVNGKIPDVSVDKFQLHSGDLIEWRLLKKQNSGCGI